jgi:hypothetical protein
MDENFKIAEPMHFWTRIHLRAARSTEKRKKVGLFQRFFHPSMANFPAIPIFSAFANFIIGKYMTDFQELFTL